MRRVMLLFALACATVACGASGFDPTLAADLAGQADAVAARLTAGDTCGAVTRVASLRADADAAIARGEVPEHLIVPLDRRLTELESVRCIPPAPTPTATPTNRERDDDGDDDRRPKGKGKGKGGDGDDD